MKVSYGIGCNRRASGHLYNYISAHDLMIGSHTGNVLSDIFLAKKFARCDIAAWLNIDPEIHDCSWIYEGIRNPIESESALVLIKYEFDKEGFIVKSVLSDND